jgi:iron complex transport system permease protein
MGGLLVVIADLLGRTLFAPIEIPCGVMTAAIGAPYFLYLLIRHRDRN